MLVISKNVGGATMSFNAFYLGSLAERVAHGECKPPNTARALSDGSLSDTAIGNVEDGQQQQNAQSSGGFGGSSRQRNIRFDPNIDGGGGGGGGKDALATSAGAAAGRPGMGPKSNSTSQLSASGNERVSPRFCSALVPRIAN